MVPELNGKLLAEGAENSLSRHESLALLSLIPDTDKGVLPYVRRSLAWTTVTPVALPGSDDGKANKTDKLIEKMFKHAGYSLANVAELEFRRVPFLRGPPPHYLANCTMYHMRIRWKHLMAGPMVLGSGRYCGLGLFAATE